MSNDMQTTSSNGLQVRPILPQNMEDAWRLSKCIFASGLAPKGFTSVEGVFTAIQMGAEVGLSPMQAVQNIAVINGRPSMWGDVQLGLVRGSGLLEEFEEKYEGEGEKLTAICTVKRKGDKNPIISEFSVKDAMVAELWNTGTWKKYPKRMLKNRARGFALRDGFSDILKGITSTEELQDMQDVTPYRESANIQDLNSKFINQPAVVAKTTTADHVEDQLKMVPDHFADISKIVPQNQISEATKMVNMPIPERTVPMLHDENGMITGADWQAYAVTACEDIKLAPTLDWIAQYRKKCDTQLGNLKKNNPDAFQMFENTLQVRGAQLK
jgi:hypothetical protein